MALRDFIKTKRDNALETEEFIELAVSTFEKNNELYSGKSIAWNVRVTADELEIKKDELLDILDKHYGTEEKAK